MNAWVDHLWQSTLLAVVVMVGLAAIGRWMSAAARRAVLAVTLGQFLLPAAWFSALLRRLAPPAHQWLAAKAVPVQLSVPVLHRLGPAVAHRPMLAALAGTLWLIGAGLVVAVAALKTARLRQRLLAEATPVGGRVAARLDIAAARAGLPQAPMCLVCPSESSPGVLGVFRPILFVPAELDQALSDEELDAILLHETVHLARRDNFWSGVQTVCAAFNWYNPVAWFVSQQLQLETEMSCDERVLGVTGDPAAYLSAIAKSVRHSLGLLAPGFSPAGSTPVGIRLGNILSFPPRPISRTLGPAVFAGLIGATLMSGYAGSVTAAPPATSDLAFDHPILSWRDSHPASQVQDTSVLLVAPRDPSDSGGAPDVMPTPIDRPAPVYPLAPRYAGVSGTTEVAYTVDAEGDIKDVVVENSDRQDFGAAALDAVRHWRYEAAQNQGTPVAVRLQVKIIFSAETPLPREMSAVNRPVVVSFK